MRIGISPSPSWAGSWYGVLADTRFWITFLLGWKTVGQIRQWMRPRDAEYGRDESQQTNAANWTLIKERVEKLENQLHSLLYAHHDLPISNRAYPAIGTLFDCGSQKRSNAEPMEVVAESEGQISWERYALLEEIEIARLREKIAQLEELNKTLAIENKQLSRRILHIAFDEGEEGEALHASKTAMAWERIANVTPEKAESANKNNRLDD